MSNERQPTMGRPRWIPAAFFLAIGSAAVAATSMPRSASARSLPAIAGEATQYGHRPCFLSIDGFVVNTCGGTAYWATPLPIDYAGTKYVTVNAFGATPSNNVGCRAMVFGQNGGYIAGSATRWLSTFGSHQNLDLGGVSLPPYANLLATCTVYPSGRVSSYVFNE